MFTSSNKLLSVQLEVCDQSGDFRKYREITIENPDSTIYVDSMVSFLRKLIEEGKKICQLENYSSFRLRIRTEKENYFLYDASLKRVDVHGEKSDVPEQERQRYEILTKKEKQILCFLYRGYRQNDMAYIFGTSVNTIKKHRYNIYDKAGFRSHADLASWCEKYLENVFTR